KGQVLWAPDPACHEVVMQAASNGKQTPPSCTRSLCWQSRCNGVAESIIHYAEIYMHAKLLAVAIAACLGGGFIPLAAAAQSQAPGGGSAELAQLQAQLQALQARVDQLQQQAPAPAQATTIPSAATDKRLAALEKVVNDTTIGGKMFFDF